MEFIEYCTAREKYNGCMGVEWLEMFTLGSHGWLGAEAGFSALHHERGL